MSDAEMAEVQRQFGPLQQDLISFLKEHNGAEPTPCVFQTSSGVQRVRYMIPVQQLSIEAYQIEGLRAGLLPVAECEGGNYVVIDVRNGGRVAFWDHEVDDEGDVIAQNWASFLETLGPWNPVLPPHVVKRVWIKPGFEHLRRKPPDKAGS